MSTSFLGEVRLFSISFAPKGWMLCNGQILPIAQNQALYALLGNTYGGVSPNTFALPDLRGRAILSAGNGHARGESGGAETVTLTTNEIPQHVHFWQGTSGSANVANPNNAYLAAASTASLYSTNVADVVPLASTTLGNAGANQPHDNMQPYLTLSYCIAITGIFPSPN